MNIYVTLKSIKLSIFTIKIECLHSMISGISLAFPCAFLLLPLSWKSFHPLCFCFAFVIHGKVTRALIYKEFDE